MYSRALKIIREYHRMSQSDAATELRLSRSYVSELESGIKKPTIEVLERYAVVFEVPISSLMLFAERSCDIDLAERTRTYVAGKVLKMLEWLRDTAEDGGAGGRANAETSHREVLALRRRIT